MSLNMNDWEARHRVMSFPETYTEFEDSRIVHVHSFSTILSPIRIAEWLEFSESTGYVSQAERDAADQTFLANSFVGDENKTGREQWLECSAMCLSWEDAQAFCLHYKVRLLTEAEWMVSTYLLPELDSSITRIAGIGRDLMNKYGRGDHAIGFSKEEWVSDRIGGDAIVRTGPKCYRMRHWKETQNWFTAPVQSYNTYRGFRVVVNRDQ